MLTFCGVMLFSAPLFGRERIKSFNEPVKIVKHSDNQQLQEQTISFRIYFYIEKIKSILHNWFEPKEPVVDDQPNFYSHDPHDDNSDIIPLKDDGWDEHIY